MSRWAREGTYDALIVAAAADAGLDPDLVKGLIGQESGFNPRAVGDDGSSFGLMQVQTATAKGVGVTGDLLDPATNLRAGCRYLAGQIHRAGSMAAGLSAYNGGYRPALGFGAPLADGRFRNQTYVDKILINTEYFHQLRVAARPVVSPVTEPGGLILSKSEIAILVLVGAVVLGGAGWLLLH